MLHANDASEPAQGALSDAYLKLIRDSALWSCPLDEALRTVLVKINAILKTQRSWLWSFGPTHERLTLVLGYNVTDQQFTYGAEIQCSNFPEYYRRFDSVYVEAIADIQVDSRFHEFATQERLDKNLKAVLNSTVHVASKSWGILTVGDYTTPRIWSDAECWFVGLIADLIAQLITNAEIRRSEHWLRFVADNLPLGILKFNLDAQCDYANPYWRRLTENMIFLGESWLHSIHSDDRSMVLDAARMIAVSGERRDLQVRLMVREKTVWTSCSLVSERNIDGMPIAVLGTFVDITHERALTESNARLHRINSIAARLYGLRDIEAVARASVEILSEHGSAPLARFFIYDDATRMATLIAQHDGRCRAELATMVQWTLDAYYVTNCTADINLFNDLDAIPTTSTRREALRERGTKSIVFIWLRSEKNRIGIIALEYPEVFVLESMQRDDLTAIGKAVSMALSNVLFISRMEHQAMHDMLTGLPNRVLLQRELQALDAEPGCSGGLMLLDLDRFKEVNDTLGHHIGDRLLIKLAERLSDTLRSSKISSSQKIVLCRLGGDEFAILIRDATVPQLQKTAADLLELMRLPMMVDQLILEVGASIGIALFPEQSADGMTLLRLADVAMYQAKRNGSGSAIYDRQFDSYTPERLALMQEMRSAIANNQMVLHYQPKLDLRSGTIYGVEALVRWQHPQRGLLAPDVFLPLAEMSDVIHALFIEVARQALLQLSDWSLRGWRYSIAVNLSARNLLNEHCFISLREMIEQYGVDANLLELEITETALMQDPVGAAKLLANLAALGIKFSIDDFGTGYSSLAYLRQLPIHALKIDRTFVSDMVRSEQDAMIVKSTIALAHNLKLNVIAEGVEDEAALAMLRGMDCDQAQGYFISKPQAAATIEQWLADSKPGLNN